MAAAPSGGPTWRRLSPQAVEGRIQAFRRRFGDAHLALAWHAAFPLALTPDLTYKLWATFAQDCRGAPLRIPWIAVADLLLSSLCDEVGHELYEMDAAVRNALLQALQASSVFGSPRLEELAAFMQDYIRPALDSSDSQTRELASVQRWTALAYARPQQAADELERALEQSAQERNPNEQLRLAAVVDALAEPLAEFEPLLAAAHAQREAVLGRRHAAPPAVNQRVPQDAAPGPASGEPPSTGAGSGASDETAPQVTVLEATEELGTHYDVLIPALQDGRVVIFLGPDASQFGRPAGVSWQPGLVLPSRPELAGMLAKRFNYPTERVPDLTAVAQHVAMMEDIPSLYAALDEVYDHDYPPMWLHRLLALLPGILRERGTGAPSLLIITANFDDLLERAGNELGQPFDLVTYRAEGEARGLFVHQPPDGDEVLIDRPNEYRRLSLERQPVIVKLLGGVNRTVPSRAGYVVTEDHYHHYMSATRGSNALPVALVSTMRANSALFLGYSLQDANLRMVLQRVWGEQRRRSWVVQAHPTELERRLWERSGATVLDVSLETYMAGLEQRLQHQPPVATQAR